MKKNKSPIKIYVSNNGDDSANGSRMNPVATFCGARNLLREKRGEEKCAAEIIIRGGEYEVHDSCVLDARDGGQEGAAVVWRAENGETVRIFGGNRIKAQQLMKDTGDAIMRRIPKKARPFIKVISFDSLPGTLTPSEPDGEFESNLFIDGERYGLARWPKHDPSVGKWPTGHYTTMTHMEHLGPHPESDDFRIYYCKEAAEKIAEWGDECLSSLTVFGHFFFGWHDIRYHVDEINRKEGYLLVKGGTGRYRGGNEEKPFFFYNIPELLDTPGECFFDCENRKVYFYPAKQDLSESEIVVSTTRESIFDLDSCEHLNICNLNVGYSCGYGIHMSGCRDILIDGGDDSHFSEQSIYITRSEEITLRNLHITDNGFSGINIEHCGDQYHLHACNILVENCHIHDVSMRKKCYTSTVRAHYTCGVTVRGCTFHQSPVTLIAAGLNNDFIIENNEFYDCCLDADDCGCISWCRCPVIVGTVIRNNYFHDIGNTSADFAIHAIYVDDYSTGPEVYNNIFVNAAIMKQDSTDREYGSFVIGHTYGNFISVHNNIFVCSGNQKPMLNYNDYALPNWIGFVNDTHVIANSDGYLWHKDLEEAGFFTDEWRYHYRGTIWERMWCYANEKHYKQAKAIFDAHAGENLDIPGHIHRYEIYEELWDHRDENGQVYEGTLQEYIADVYRIVYRTYRTSPPNPKDIREPMMHLIEDLMYDDKIRIDPGNTYTNNLTIGVDALYLGRNRKTWGHGCRGIEQNYNPLTDKLPNGKTIFKKPGSDYALTEEGLAAVRKVIPQFLPIDTSIIGYHAPKKKTH